MTARASLCIRISIAVAAFAILAWAASASLRRYWAERLVQTPSVENLDRAVRLAPFHSDAWARLGAARERRGDEAGARAALEHAVALNPYNPRAWVDLGLHWELAGDAARGEHCLREAVRVDTTFFPRWALANFYLRQQGGDQFWDAIRRAIAAKPDDLTPAFELCWRALPDAGEILDKGIPDDPRINHHYQEYLMATGRTAAAAGVWKRIQHRLQRDDLPMALSYTDLLLNARQFDAALGVWNRLCDGGLLPHQSLDPAQQRSLTNGRFQFEPSGRGFDWTAPPADGVAAEAQVFSGSTGLRIQFSGTHPEAATLVTQQAPVEPQRLYRLISRYTTEQLPADTGLAWAVEDVLSGSRLASGRSLAAAADQWKEDQTSFHTSARTRLVRLLFAYRRAPGTTRAQGSVFLRDLELVPVDRPTLSRSLRP